LLLLKAIIRREDLKEKKKMTKIILAFPCMGKTYYAEQHPNTALDLESSDFLFDRTGYEHEKHIKN
jgi:hypothetical protein